MNGSLFYSLSVLFHARIQEYLPGCPGLKTALTTSFLILNLFYSYIEGVQVSEEGPTLSRGGGSNLFQGEGPNADFYRNPYNL